MYTRLWQKVFLKRKRVPHLFAPALLRQERQAPSLKMEEELGFQAEGAKGKGTNIYSVCGRTFFPGSVTKIVSLFWTTILSFCLFLNISWILRIFQQRVVLPPLYGGCDLKSIWGVHLWLVGKLCLSVSSWVFPFISYPCFFWSQSTHLFKNIELCVFFLCP